MAVMQTALASITAEDILRRTSVLAADSMEGRLPGTVGEERTVRYIEEQFRSLGLDPGNPDGTYQQEVPLVGITPKVTAWLTIKGQDIPLHGERDYIAESTHVTSEIVVEGSELVFVGYGVVAPEYGWDDYKDVEVKGKTVVMLVNDPPIRLAGDTVLDQSMFRGKAMTYYGRWTYKYEIAAEKGAAAAIVIHETGPAGYPFDVLSGGFQRESFTIKSADDNIGEVAVQAWMSGPAARSLLGQMGYDFDQLKDQAVRSDFRPVALGAQANFDLEQQLREVQSRNVLAKLEGTTRSSEYVVYTAHWDHLGRDASLTEDQIYNGAIDNASGMATVIEIAEAFTELSRRPDRSILFLAVTAEEQGLLGAKYYAENPLYPLVKTVANVNVDMINQWGRTEDIVVVGRGNSTLDDVLAAAAITQGRVLESDPETEKGLFYRSDQFEFAKQGVPALFTASGTRYVGKDSSYGLTKRGEYTNGDYHGVNDEVKADWDLGGVVEDAQLLFQVGYRVSQRAAFPEWSTGTEFKARRDAMLGQIP
ncbi:MAG TPA: peptidase M28 [Gemmatimonadetes bacterium]|nr:peptidase M28 [Gemmatimonadota bacterium]